MRKLCLAVTLLSALPACERAEEGAQPARSRVEAAQVGKPLATARQWCSAYYAPKEAPALELPAVTAVRPAARDWRPASGHWQWLNLWATWCRPCLREMPEVVAFGQQLRKEGLAVDNWFIALDDESASVEAFMRSHPDLASDQALRLLDPDALDSWAGRYGLAAGTSIPINVFASPDGKVRCIRAGAIAAGDYAVVRAAVREMQGG
jgi:thiol-disulfide isomerase/thioredoxin